MPYTLYGWQVSYYTGKVRSYLRFKGIHYVETSSNLFNYCLSLRRKTDVVALPILQTPEGQWQRDSSIIDHLEEKFPDRANLPDSPVPRMLAYLFELWGDEFWLPTGLITRCCRMEENYPFLEWDVANDLLLGWPQWLQKKAAAKVAAKVAQHMYCYLPKAGVIPTQYSVLERWIELQLDALDQHFAQYPYLLGNRPSLGDFGLMAPLHGHMSRAGRVPRFLDEVEFPMGIGRFHRPAMPYALWMLQRMLDDWRAMLVLDAKAVRIWLSSHGAGRFLEIQLPHLRRDGLQVAVE